MAKKQKKDTVEIIYRIREKSTGKMKGGGKGQIYTSKGQCENHCRNLNMKRTSEDIKNDVVFEVITYEVSEVTRQYKINNILKEE